MKSLAVHRRSGSSSRNKLKLTNVDRVHGKRIKSTCAMGAGLPKNDLVFNSMWPTARERKLGAKMGHLDITFQITQRTDCLAFLSTQY